MSVKFKNKSENCEVLWILDFQGFAWIVEILTMIIVFTAY